MADARKSKADFLEFRIKIPKIKNQTDQPCDQCNGSGRDRLLQDECLKCRGTGKKIEYNWQGANAISASLTVLLMILKMAKPEVSKKEISSPLPQLMTVETITRREQHGGSLYGKYSVSFCRWLSSLGRNTDILEMVEAMKVAYCRMFGWDLYNTSSFRARVDYDNGWLNVSCPGDACGLHPSHGSVTKGESYEFSCHNVDTPAQQLTLLAGLAALHDKARKEMK